MYILYWQPTLDICWTSQFLLSAGSVCPASHVVFTFAKEKCAPATLSARRMNGQDRRKISIKRRRQEEEGGGQRVKLIRPFNIGDQVPAPVLPGWRKFQYLAELIRNVWREVRGMSVGKPDSWSRCSEGLLVARRMVRHHRNITPRSNRT